MTRKQALAELIAKVEAGEVVQAIDARALWPEIGIWGEVCQASQGSLDAAKALHDAVLPGWDWDVGIFADVTPHFEASVTQHNAYGDVSFAAQGLANNPARAWLLAILRALHAQEAAE